MFCNRYILLTTLLLMQFALPAQKNVLYKRCPVKTLNYENGLLNNSTTNVITDARGFTWFSTQTGVQRFNGYVLEKITPVINNETISFDAPVFFFRLKNGSILMSYKRGILEYNAGTGSFKQDISLPNDNNVNYSLMPLKQTPQGILCLQQKKGIVLYNNKWQAIKILSDFRNLPFIDSIFQEPDLLPGGTVAVNNKDIFLKNYQNQLIRINAQTGEQRIINCSSPIYAFTCDDKNLYIAAIAGLMRYNLADNKTETTISFQKLKGENVIACQVSFGGNNQLFFGVNRYLFETDLSLSHYREYTTLKREPVTAVGYIRSIYADKFKRIWLLTNDDIKRVQNINIPFDHFIYTNEKNNFVRCIYYDEQKHLLLAGCFNGGIQLYDTSGNALWQHALSSENIKNINDIEKLTNEDYLIETYDKGWYTLHLPNRQIKKFQLPAAIENALPIQDINFCSNLQRLNDSVILVATVHNIFRCTFKNKSIQSAQPLLPLDKNINSINNLFYTNDKTIWVGTALGNIYILDNDKKISAIDIPGNYQVRCLAEDVLHNIWVGTDKGLYVYDKNGKLEKSFFTDSGLLNDCIYALLPINNKPAVFASTNLGLSDVNFNGEIQNFTREAGLQENEFNTESAVKTLNGKFYFGGINGITAFYPSALSQISDTPFLNITKLLVNDSLFNPASEILKNDSVILKYYQNHIQLDFAAIGVLNTNEYNYQYRLKNFEKNWQATQQPTGIKYVLPPGNYLFEIKCSPVFSSHNIFKKTIAIIITPPWWQTWWFRILLIVFSVVLIAFIVQQIFHRRYQKKLRVLQMQNEIQRERERISRDLHDNIGAQISFISSNIDWIIDKNKELNKEEELKQMMAINSAAKNVMINLRETIWALHKDEISLQEFCDKLKAYIQNMLQLQPGLEFKSEERIEKNLLLTPTEMLNIFRICQEAVNNVLKHANASLLKLVMESGGNSFHISIIDNGAGFSKTTVPEDHYGLKNMEHRAKEAGIMLSIHTAESNGTAIEIDKYYK